MQPRQPSDDGSRRGRCRQHRGHGHPQRGLRQNVPRRPQTGFGQPQWSDRNFGPQRHERQEERKSDERDFPDKLAEHRPRGHPQGHANARHQHGVAEECPPRRSRSGHHHQHKTHSRDDSDLRGQIRPGHRSRPRSPGINTLHPDHLRHVDAHPRRALRRFTSANKPKATAAVIATPTSPASARSHGSLRPATA